MCCDNDDTLPSSALALLGTSREKDVGSREGAPPACRSTWLPAGLSVLSLLASAAPPLLPCCREVASPFPPATPLLPLPFPAADDLWGSRCIGMISELVRPGRRPLVPLFLLGPNHATGRMMPAGPWVGDTLALELPLLGCFSNSLEKFMRGRVKLRRLPAPKADLSADRLPATASGRTTRAAFAPGVPLSPAIAIPPTLPAPKLPSSAASSAVIGAGDAGLKDALVAAADADAAAAAAVRWRSSAAWMM